jgi:type II secretory pathway component PulK/DNA uptake protein ComE-like DNA-binding protein
MTRHSHNSLDPNSGRLKHEGMILIIVLVVILMLSLGAYTFTDLMITYDEAADLSGERIQARWTADSGIDMIRMHLILPDQQRYDAGGEYNNSMMFQAINVVPDTNPRNIANFTAVAPFVDQTGLMSGIRYGLEDESARINLNALLLADTYVTNGGRTLLMALPGMSEDVADSILDWIDEDDDTREYGAEYDYYQSLVPPYSPKNGPLDTVEELLLIRGVFPQLLFGQDANRNGMVDPSETGLINNGANPANQAMTPPATAMTGDPAMAGIERGWASFLTLYSQEANLNAAGEPRIDVNSEDLETLHQDLQSKFSLDVANFIILYRQSESNSSETENGVPAATIEMDFTLPPSRSITQLLELVEIRLEVEGLEGPVLVNPAFPLNSLGAYVDNLMDNAAANSNPTIPGRININQAPRSLLMGIPGITEEIVDRIIQERIPDPAEDVSKMQPTEAWLLKNLIVDLDEFRQMLPFICVGGDVFRTQVIGYFEDGAASSRVEVVIDRTTATPRIRLWRDLSHLGRGYSLEMLGLQYIDGSVPGQAPMSLPTP